MKSDRTNLQALLRNNEILPEVAKVVQEQLGGFLTSVSREDLFLLIFYNHRLAEARKLGDAKRVELAQGRLDRLVESIQFQFEGVAEGGWGDKIEPIFIKALEILLMSVIKAAVPA
jgi:hypothetical protein